MRTRIRNFLVLPSEIREDFWRESLRKNSLSLQVICVIIFGVELYNICRVLFWSRSGLGTLNNRIYFSMYCTLMAVAVLCLVLERLLRGASIRVRWAVQYVVILLLLLWHVGLNAYDLYRNPDAGLTVFITAILGLAIFIRMSAPFSFLGFGLAYGFFQITSAHMLSSGDVLNITITVVVAIAVSLTNARHGAVDLLQRREIVQINARLQELVLKDPMTGLLNKEAMKQLVEQSLEKGGELTFIMVDLDDFKVINDNCGHPCGDYVLIETAQKLRTVFPNAAGIGRIGGDEFAVLLDGALEEAAVRSMGEQMIREIGGIHWQGQKMNVCCSLGISRCGCPISYEQLYLETDRALYRAKGNGKGCCCFCQISQCGVLEE